MNNAESQTLSSQPGFIQPIRTGFNVAANHVLLLLFPILMDIWIWLGIHLSMRKTMTSFITDLQRMVMDSTDEISGVFTITKELLVDRFNLMTALRTFPVGIPSLMSSRLPIEVPYGIPLFFDVNGVWYGIIWFLGLAVVGLALGTYYYQVMAHAALKGSPKWIAALKDWPWAFWQVITLTVVWVGIIIAISIPFSCLFPVISSAGLSQFVGFVYLAVMVWFFFPLLFSAHGIFVYREKMMVSIMKSIHLTRLTLPATSIFVIFGFFALQGLDIVWGWPQENSWLVLIGLAGHAFVANAILAASFLYFRDADQWVQRFLRQLLLSRNA